MTFIYTGYLALLVCLNDSTTELVADEDDGEEGLQCLTITSLISPSRKHAMPCFDWLTVRGRWVRVRAVLLIKPTINISITSALTSGLTKLAYRRQFPHTKKMLVFFLLKIFQESNNTSFIYWNRKMIKCQKPNRREEDNVSRGCPFKVCLFKSKRDLFFFLCVGCTSPRWQSSLDTSHSLHNLGRVCAAAGVCLTFSLHLRLSHTRSTYSPNSIRPSYCLACAPILDVLAHTETYELIADE